MKILVIQSAYLGDCVLTLPLINSIKKSVSCHISVVSIPHTKEVFETCPSVDEVICYDKRGKDRGVFGEMRLVKRLRKKKFDIAFLPQRSFRSGLIAFLSGISERVGFIRGGARFFCTRSAEFDWNKHEVERLLSLAETAGYENLVKDFGLVPDAGIQSKYQGMLSPNMKIIGISAQSPWYTKCWPWLRFEELIKSISEKNTVVLLGKEKQNIEGKNIVNLTGKTSVKDLVGIISFFDVMVSNDSGLMHIGAALNVPVVAIYGPTVAGMGFAPYGDIHTIVDVPLECRPCGLHGGDACPMGHFRCMLDIPVERVLTEINKKLNESDH